MLILGKNLLGCGFRLLINDYNLLKLRGSFGCELDVVDFFGLWFYAQMLELVNAMLRIKLKLLNIFPSR